MWSPAATDAGDGVGGSASGAFQCSPLQAVGMAEDAAVQADEEMQDGGHCGGQSRSTGKGTAPGEALRIVDDLVELSRVLGDEAVLNALLASGERLDTRREELGFELALCLAAGRGDMSTVEQALSSGVEVNAAPSFGGMTPLMFAARFGNLQIMEVLLFQSGLALHSTTSEGQTALSLCRDNATRRLAAHAIVARSGDGGRYALVQAACLGHAAVLRCLLDVQVDPNQRDEKGRTALFIGAVRHQLEVCEALLAGGADPHLVDANGLSTWQVADEKLRTALQFYAAVMS
mmetsp:Transcript_82294/g.145885  ORF Transcript_82294/g.145885 Transcript_82294/m.145885 type:complete len:290 (-) Transcript_82294:86-955(-)